MVAMGSDVQWPRSCSMSRCVDRGNSALRSIIREERSRLSGNRDDHITFYLFVWRCRFSRLRWDLSYSRLFFPFSCSERSLQPSTAQSRSFDCRTNCNDALPLTSFAAVANSNESTTLPNSWTNAEISFSDSFAGGNWKNSSKLCQRNVLPSILKQTYCLWKK